MITTKSCACDPGLLVPPPSERPTWPGHASRPACKVRIFPTQPPQPQPTLDLGDDALEASLRQHAAGGFCSSAGSWRKSYWATASQRGRGPKAKQAPLLCALCDARVRPLRIAARLPVLHFFSRACAARHRIYLLAFALGRLEEQGQKLYCVVLGHLPGMQPVPKVFLMPISCRTCNHRQVDIGAHSSLRL